MPSSKQGTNIIPITIGGLNLINDIDGILTYEGEKNHIVMVNTNHLKRGVITIKDIRDAYKDFKDGN